MKKIMALLFLICMMRIPLMAWHLTPPEERQDIITDCIVTYLERNGHCVKLRLIAVPNGEWLEFYIDCHENVL